MLQAIPGVELVEMPRNKENSWCCGAGGGVKSGYPDWAVEVSVERVKEAEQLGVEAILSACPFCERNLTDAVNNLGLKLKVLDVVELVNKSL